MKKDKEKDTVSANGLMGLHTEEDGSMGSDMDMVSLIHKVNHTKVSG